MTKQTPKKRFQVRKFIGQEYSVIDVVKNATVNVHPSRQVAQQVADQLNAGKKGGNRNG